MHHIGISTHPLGSRARAVHILGRALLPEGWPAAYEVLACPPRAQYGLFRVANICKAMPRVAGLLSTVQTVPNSCLFSLPHLRVPETAVQCDWSLIDL
jgi:hypothetical protein